MDREEILQDLKRMNPDEVESMLLTLMEDVWDTIELTHNPELLEAYEVVDNYLNGDRSNPWSQVLEAIATLEEFRLSQRRLPETEGRTDGIP